MNKKKTLNIIKISAIVIILIIFGIRRIREFSNQEETEYVISISDTCKMVKDAEVIKGNDFIYFDDIWRSTFFVGRNIR